MRSLATETEQTRGQFRQRAFFPNGRAQHRRGVHFPGVAQTEGHRLQPAQGTEVALHGFIPRIEARRFEDAVIQRHHPMSRLHPARHRQTRRGLHLLHFLHDQRIHIRSAAPFAPGQRRRRAQHQPHPPGRRGKGLRGHAVGGFPDFRQHRFQYRRQARRLLRLHLRHRLLQQHMEGIERRVRRDEHRLPGKDVRRKDLPPRLVRDDDLVFRQLRLLRIREITGFRRKSTGTSERDDQQRQKVFHRE